MVGCCELGGFGGNGDFDRSGDFCRLLLFAGLAGDAFGFGGKFKINFRQLAEGNNFRAGRDYLYGFQIFGDRRMDLRSVAFGFGRNGGVVLGSENSEYSESQNVRKVRESEIQTVLIPAFRFLTF